VAPAVNATVGAGPASAKSDWFVLVIAVCVIDPDVAVNERGTVPGAASLPAVITTVWEKPDEPPETAVLPPTSCWGVSGDRVKVVGAAVTVVGNPESDTFTAPENPFTPAIEMEIVCVEFGVTVTLAGMVTEKSGCETESGVLAATPLPPPQPVKRNGRAMLQTDHNNLDELAIILDLAAGAGPLSGPSCLKKNSQSALDSNKLDRKVIPRKLQPQRSEEMRAADLGFR